MRRVCRLSSIVLLGAALSTAVGLTAQTRSLPPFEIQGAGARSPYDGVMVTTAGVVTARKTNGFFIQAPDGAGDGLATTSDALFVFTSSAPPATVTVGALVEVTGRVLEFVPSADPASPPLTELTDVTAIDVRGAGATLPVPIDLSTIDRGPTTGDVSPLEAYEAMRVRIPSLTAVSGTLGSVNEANATAASNGVFYGVVAGVPRPFRRPGIAADQRIPPEAPCCVPRYDGSPERIRVDSDGQPGTAAINLAAGAVVRDVVGPLDFGFRSYTVLPDLGSPPRVDGAQAFAPPAPPEESQVSLASLNLQRFYDATDDPGLVDPVLTAAAYQARLRKASLYIRRLLHLPHIIGVQEVENLATLRELADALNREAREARQLKTRYEAYLEEGHDPGGIDVGLLVDRARVEVLQVAQEGWGEQFRGPGGALEFLHDRPPLTLRARVTWPVVRARPFNVIVTHVRSLIDIDHPVNGPRVRVKRALQAEAIAAMVDRRQSVDAADLLVVMGDMNAFEFSDGFVDVVGTIRGAPAPRERVVQATRDLVSPDLVVLAEAAPSTARYSYVFDGVAQVLDHMLVSQDLWEFVSAFGYVRGNADAPETWRSDATRPERLSDHDAALLYLTLPRN